MTPTTTVDQTGIKTGQLTVAVVLLLAFVANAPWLTVLVGAAQLSSALDVRNAPLKLLYKHVVKPLGIVQPNPQPDHNQPHRFSALIGSMFNFGAALLFALSAPLIGWTLVWIVIALANLSVWGNLCVGCWFYYRLSRFGVPGFALEG